MSYSIPRVVVSNIILNLIYAVCCLTCKLCNIYSSILCCYVELIKKNMFRLINYELWFLSGYDKDMADNEDKIVLHRYAFYMIKVFFNKIGGKVHSLFTLTVKNTWFIKKLFFMLTFTLVTERKYLFFNYNKVYQTQRISFYAIYGKLQFWSLY
jgi:hypothetical protein